MEQLKFEDVYKINVNEHTDEKNGLTYLSWAWAWAEFKKAYPTAEYKIKRFENNLPYVYDEKTGYMVFTEVTVDGLTYEMWLPVMDGANKAMKAEEYSYFAGKGERQVEKWVDAATMTDINKAIMRCLTKNLAMFGLGLYIYAGEDLPEGYKEPLNEALVSEFVGLGGTLDIAATYFKIPVDELTDEHLRVLIDGKKKALAKAKKNA
ncbi:MAG: DUF1071 domain-containing protein [Clostridia bacterium]|nr:DUF1071 domain-containing protein [Clostridia bacterium]